MFLRKRYYQPDHGPAEFQGNVLSPVPGPQPLGGVLSQPAPANDGICFDAAIVSRTVTALSPRDAVYLQPQQVLSLLDSPARMAREIPGRLRVITAINTIRGFIALQRPVLEMILDLVPAQRGAIVLNREGPEALTPVFAAGAEPASLRVCEQLTRRVLRDGVALACNDAYDPQTGGERSIIAAPLVNFDRVLGLIYLETQDRNVRFDDGHLHLLLTIGVIGGAVLENAHHLELVENENERLRQEISLEHAMVGDGQRIKEVF